MRCAIFFACKSKDGGVECLHASSSSHHRCCLCVACQGQKPFVIKTTPPGATVSINGKEYAGKTPLEVEIAQDKDLGIVVHKDGYAVESATVNTQTSWLGSLLWTESSPHARYIEEDEITIPLRRL